MAEHRITRRRPALRDLQEHFEFLYKQAGLDTADRFLQAAETTISDLAAMPEMGSLQHFTNPRFAGTRRWRVRGFDNYLIFYRPLPNGIEILRVLYASRNIASLFE